MSRPKRLHKLNRPRIPFHACIPQPEIKPGQAYPNCLVCGRAIKTVIKLERTTPEGQKSQYLIALNKGIMERVKRTKVSDH